MNNFYNSPAFPDKLVRLFNSKYVEFGYGSPMPITKQVRGMLSGFIKVCRSSGWHEMKIYKSIENIVINWNFIKKCDHHTMKNHKKVLLGDRPSLLEFLICRETILFAVEKAIAVEQSMENAITKEIKPIQVQSIRKSFAPSEEDMEEEYNRMMEDQ